MEPGHPNPVSIVGSFGNTLGLTEANVYTETLSSATAGDPRSGSTILRKLPTLALLSAGGSVITGVVSLVAARYLGSSRYGEAQTVLLAYGIGGLLQAGVYAGAVRAAIHARGRGDDRSATKVQNLGVTFELLASLVPGLVIASFALFTTSDLLRLGFLLAPLVAAASSLASFLGGIAMAKEHQQRATVAASLGSLVAGTVVLATLSALGPYAMLLGPPLGSLTAVVLLIPYEIRDGLRADFDWRSARPLARAGLPFAGSGIVYWLYRWVGPTSVTIGLGARALGYYTIANAPVLLVSSGLSIVPALIMPRFWQDVGRSDRPWVREGDRVTSLLVVGTAAITSLGLILFPWFVRTFLPEYRPAIPVFCILALEIVLFNISSAPTLVLGSVAVDRQQTVFRAMAAAFVANIAANAVVLLLGAGMVAIAIDDVAVQLIFVGTLFLLARRHQGSFRSRQHDLAPAAVVLVAIGAAATVIAAGSASLARGDDTTSGMAARTVVLGVTWLLVAVVLAAWRGVERLVRRRGATPDVGTA